MTKEQAQSWMLNLMIETLMHAIENSETPQEFMVLSKEVDRLQKRKNKVGA
jgi:hypothetical protein